MASLQVRWSSRALVRRLPVRVEDRQTQGQAGSGGAAAVAAARPQPVPAVEVVACWSEDLFVISITSEMLCTAGEISI